MPCVVVMDKNRLSDERGVNVDNPLRNTKKEGEKTYKCNQCDYAYSTKSSLRRHLKTHSGEKPNKCNQCNYASSQAGTLRAHLKTHSGEKLNKQRHLKTHGGEKQNLSDA